MRLAGGVARIPGKRNLVLRTGPVNHFSDTTDLDSTTPTNRRPWRPISQGEFGSPPAASSEPTSAQGLQLLMARESPLAQGATRPALARRCGVLPNSTTQHNLRRIGTHDDYRPTQRPGGQAGHVSGSIEGRSASIASTSARNAGSGAARSRAADRRVNLGVALPGREPDKGGGRRRGTGRPPWQGGAVRGDGPTPPPRVRPAA